MDQGTRPGVTHTCTFCNKTFAREQSLMVHVCEQKKRFQEQNEVGVQIGFNAYLRFYEITQGSSKLKTYDDFAKSPYYRAFVKFGRYTQSIKAINVPRMVDWLVRNNKKIDHWCKDSMYGEYLQYYVRIETVEDALARALETGLDWSEQTGHPSHDYLRFGNSNALCYAVSTGKISPWIVYNCESGNKFLHDLNEEQIAVIWSMIDSDFWQKKFKDYPSDQIYVQEMLDKAGW